MNYESATLHDYDTAEVIREATAAELAESIEAAKHDGGAGVIEAEDHPGRRCYVMEGWERRNREALA